MNSFMGNMQEYISESVTVEGWRTSMPYAGYKEGRDIQLDQTDLDYTQAPRWQGTIENVSLATAFTSATLSLNGLSVAGSLRGVMPEYQQQEKIRMAAGRFLNPDDVRENRKSIVVSSAQAKELLPKNPEKLVGQWINTGSVAFRVVGIYSTDESNMTRLCPIPYSTGIKARHHIAPDDNRGLWVNNGYTENLQMHKASRMIRTALWILGILTLVSGIVGVSNIMLITVKERTHEFGIRKAIGAKPGAILKLIIAESISITAVFGYIGMFMGMVACQIMDKTVAQDVVNIGGEEIRMLVNPNVGLDVALEATLLLIVAGTLAGAIPAWKAARVKPIEALRAE